MIHFHFVKLTMAITAFLLAACQAPASMSNLSMLGPGDQISGMTLKTGAAEALPLWKFCSYQESDTVTTANCQVPLGSELAIGFVSPAAYRVFHGQAWSEIDWEISIDDQIINLDDFDTYDYIQPTMPASPSPVREVFMRVPARDIVLTDLQSGAYTLRGAVHTDAEDYSWVVNLVISSQ